MSEAIFFEERDVVLERVLLITYVRINDACDLGMFLSISTTKENLHNKPHR
jgi:hypothetical protein